MFYAQFVLSKKGPLAKIWLAAHWEKKLSKAQIYETNVQDAVDEILKPKVKMALRTTGHLLLGIVRIYSRKAKYLLADCNEAFLKIKMAFRPGQVDLAEECREAQINAITLPEVFHDFDAALPDFNEMDMQAQLQMNQSRIDDITIKEDLPKSNNMLFGSDFGTDDFGEAATMSMIGDDAMEGERQGSTFGGISGLGGDGSRLEDMQGLNLMDIPEDFGLDEMYNDVVDIAKLETAAPGAEDDMPLDTGNKLDESVMMTQINEESFALEPLDASLVVQQGLEKHIRPKRKRRLIVDEQKNISGEEMKANMADVRDTTAQLDLAPPTKKLMHLRETGSVDKLFQNPGCSNLRAKSIVKLYQSHLVLKSRVDMRTRNGNASVLDELDMAQNPEIDDAQSHTNNVDYQERLAVVVEEPAGQDEYEADRGEPSVSPIEAMNEEPDEPLASPKERHASPDKKKERKSRPSTVADRTMDDDDDAEDDHRWTKRTQHVLNTIATKLKVSDDEEVPFTDLTKGATRKSAAQKFYTLLVLKKCLAIDVRQEEPFAEIRVLAGPKMDESISV